MPACSGTARAGGAPAAGGPGRSRSRTLAGDRLVGPDGPLEISLALPGRATKAAALYAVAAAGAVGVAATDALRAIRTVEGVDGRYAPQPVGAEHAVSLFMVKNPAGWSEVIELCLADPDPVVFYVDPFGPKDTATLWDAPVERLAGRHFVTSGQRGPDVAAWLEVGGATAEVVDDPLDAVRRQPPGRVVVAVNYLAFKRLKARLHT